MIVFSIGRPGSGKSTLSKKIAEAYGLSYIGTGDIARELAVTDEETKTALDAGKVAPPQKMRRAVLNRIERFTMMDGFPRYYEQLTDLLVRVNQLDMKLEDVYFLYVMQTEQECVKRLMVREREDDTVMQIASRMSTFTQLTMPMIDYISTMLPKQIICIPSDKDPCGSFSLVKTVLGDRLRDFVTEAVKGPVQ